jgi:hypothetical protein
MRVSSRGTLGPTFLVTAILSAEANMRSKSATMIGTMRVSSWGTLGPTILVTAVLSAETAVLSAEANVRNKSATMIATRTFGPTLLMMGGLSV